MAGGSRKFKKAEKAKIKLKGAKLPKGTNVTKTKFKVKKIVIPDQIKQRNLTDVASLSSRNLSTKDCISKLKSNNTAAKCEGLRGLREIIAKKPSEIMENLSNAIKGIASLAIDIERDVRSECYRALGCVFAVAGEQNVFPFFELLLSFLRCGMTHIQPRIQEDSLLFLDVLLMYLPQLILEQRDKILPQFLDMISKLRTDSKPERTLTLSLNKQSTNTKWRTRVLTRLIGILQVLLSSKKRLAATSSDNVELEPMDQDDNPFNTKISRPATNIMQVDNRFDKEKIMHFPLIKRHLYEPSPLPNLFRKTMGDKTFALSDRIDEGRKLKTYIQMLMPLLFESWLEVRPNFADIEHMQHLLSNEAAMTLNQLLEISIQLWNLITVYNRETNNHDLMHWFQNEYASTFDQHILKGFPYHQNTVGGASKPKGQVEFTGRNIDEHCYQQNFNICYLYCCLHKEFRSDKAKAYEKVVGYMEKSVMNWKFRGQETTSLLLKVLRYMLLETNSVAINQNNRNLLKTLLEVYIKTKLPQELRNRILILLCDIIVLNDYLWRSYGQEIFTLWLKMLPLLLCKPSVDFHVLKALLCLAKQNNVIFLESLKGNIDLIVENLSKIEITNEPSPHEGQYQIVNLIFWLRDRTTLEMLLEGEKLQSMALEKNLSEYYQATLRSRMVML